MVALLAARSRSLQGRPPEDMAKLVVYTSDQVWLTHCCCIHETPQSWIVRLFRAAEPQRKQTRSRSACCCRRTLACVKRA